MSRSLCQHCQLPLARCLCDCVTQCESDVQIVIWQHPSEAGHAKNSVPLLKACLPETQLIVAEQLSHEEFSNMIPADNRELALLFPSQTVGEVNRFTAPQPTANTRLLALDGTWRKARKLIHLNSWLKSLPCLTLENPPQSRYHIRKAEQAGQLSTLEAICAALIQLEGHSETAAPILDAFAQYLDKLAQFRPSQH